jgi:hypothetical protein
VRVRVRERSPTNRIDIAWATATALPNRVYLGVHQHRIIRLTSAAVADISANTITKTPGIARCFLSLAISSEICSTCARRPEGLARTFQRDRRIDRQTSELREKRGCDSFAPHRRLFYIGSLKIADRPSFYVCARLRGRLPVLVRVRVRGRLRAGATNATTTTTTTSTTTTTAAETTTRAPGRGEGVEKT